MAKSPKTPVVKILDLRKTAPKKVVPVKRARPARPAKVAPTSQAPDQQELTCAFDGHTWYRERKRGRSPAQCPEHTAQKLAEPRTAEDKKASDEKKRAAGDARAAALDAALRSSGSHLSQQPAVPRSYSLLEIIKRIEQLEMTVAELTERFNA